MSDIQNTFSDSDSLGPPISDIEDYLELRTKLDTRLAGYQPVTTSNGKPSYDDAPEFLREVFRYIPADGRANLVEDVCERADDDEIRQLAESIEDGAVKPMLAASGRTPNTVTPSPRLGLEESIERLEALDVGSASWSDHRSLKERCLARDGNRCVISGAWSNEVRSGANTGPLQAAHIIPFSLGRVGDRNERCEKWKMWTSLWRLFPYLRTLLTSNEGVNQEDNLVTLLGPLHTDFGGFRLALEATDTLNQYRVKTFRDFSGIFDYLLPATRMILLTSHDDRYSLPSPHLLAIHAAIANILHTTARGEKMMEILRNLGGGGPSVMAKDGSTDIGNLLSMTSLALISPVRYNQSLTKQSVAEEHRRRYSMEDIENQPPVANAD